MKKACGNRFLRFGVIMTIVALMFPLQTTGQNRSLEKFKKAAQKTFNVLDNLLCAVDSAYVEDNLYNLTFMPEYSYNYEYYKFQSTANGGQGINIVPQGRNLLTLYFGWRWIILGYTIDLQNNRQITEFKTSLYSARFGLDLYYRNSSDGYKIKSLDGFSDGEKHIQDFNNNFNALTVNQIGIGVSYAFNKRFSYSAAYGQSTIQRASAGSIILGMGYNQQKFELNHKHLNPLVIAQLQNELKFNKAEFKDFSISLGYGYNWVFAKNFLASLTLTPAVSYKKSSLELNDSKSIQANINLDFTTRAAIVYNNNKYYFGASLESFTYLNNVNHLSISNGFGVLGIYVGYNFWRKK